MRRLASGIIGLSLLLAAAAFAWIAGEVVFAWPPYLLIFEGAAIACALAAPVLCLFGWAIRWLTLQAES